jgi:hypothetical protein
MRSDDVFNQANAIVREQRERMKKLLLAQASPPVFTAPVIVRKVPDNPKATRPSFELVNEPLEVSPIKSELSGEVPPSRATPPNKKELKEALLDCTCGFLGRACWVCGNSARLGRSIDERPVNIGKALQEREWSRQVGLPQSVVDQDSALKFWRRALDMKTSNSFCSLCNTKKPGNWAAADSCLSDQSPVHSP